MTKPLDALHRDSAEKVLAANSFTHNYQMNDWLNNLDVRAGDTIAFHEVSVRPEFDEVPEAPPAFIETPAPAPALAGGDQPF